MPGAKWHMACATNSMAPTKNALAHARCQVAPGMCHKQHGMPGAKWCYNQHGTYQKSPGTYVPGTHSANGTCHVPRHLARTSTTFFLPKIIQTCCFVTFLIPKDTQS